MSANDPASNPGPLAQSLAEIHIRDPFVFAAPTEQVYYLYGTNGHLAPGAGLDAYVSHDLKTWTGPIAVFRPEPGFWATQDFWAPEVHAYKGQYYMFASFKAPGVRRGTQILKSDSPRGPFRTLTDGPITPRDWDCLDGTLYVNPAGQPWMVFCHEWTQIGDGTICAMSLSPDLRTATAAPVTLFKATDAPWVKPIGPEKKGYVTDGPFLHKTRSGGLLMLWSSFGDGGYKLALAKSPSGDIAGPWRQEAQPLFREDGGHAMIFRAFDGALLLSLHQPNKGPAERTRLFTVKETEDGASLAIAPYTPVH